MDVLYSVLPFLRVHLSDLMDHIDKHCHGYMEEIKENRASGTHG